MTWHVRCIFNLPYHFTDGVRGKGYGKARRVLSLLFPFWLVSWSRGRMKMNESIESSWHGMNASSSSTKASTDGQTVARSLSLVTDDAFLFFDDDKNDRRNRTRRQTHRSTSTTSTQDIGTIAE